MDAVVCFSIQLSLCTERKPQFSAKFIVLSIWWCSPEDDGPPKSHIIAIRPMRELKYPTLHIIYQEHHYRVIQPTVHICCYRVIQIGAEISTTVSSSQKSSRKHLVTAAGIEIFTIGSIAVNSECGQHTMIYRSLQLNFIHQNNFMASSVLCRFTQSSLVSKSM